MTQVRWPHPIPKSKCGLSKQCVAPPWPQWLVQRQTYDLNQPNRLNSGISLKLINQEALNWKLVGIIICERLPRIVLTQRKAELRDGEAPCPDEAVYTWISHTWSQSYPHSLQLHNRVGQEAPTSSSSSSHICVTLKKSRVLTDKHLCSSPALGKLEPIHHAGQLKAAWTTLYA